ncbi:hypothetical protein DFH09DRAFT_1338811 [Mycena vulgaris]|nr:hypothetical protein DFH09DRAFT_1338811 [Mycena vulgaris]
MSAILAAVAFPHDFTLGPERSGAGDHIACQYVDAKTGLPLQALLVGVVSEIIAVGNGVHIVVLEAPGQDAPVLRVMFVEQSQTLDSVMAAGRLDTTRLIIHMQHWSQEPAEKFGGAVYVTLTADTVISSNNFSVEAPPAAFASVVDEIPVVSAAEAALEPGALMVFNVYLARTDAIHADGPQRARSVYARVYILHASHGIRFLRSRHAEGDGA